MAVTIDHSSVRGVGSPTPTAIELSGTVTGCERLVVYSSCSSAPVLFNVNANTWHVSIRNDRGCTCGSDIDITVQCDAGMGEPASAVYKGKLVCEACPTVLVTPILPAPDTPCDAAGRRPVTFQIQVNAAAGSAAVVYVDYLGKGTANSPPVYAPASGTGSGAGTYSYPPGTHTALAVISVPPGCPASPIPVTFTLPACPAAACTETVTEIRFSVADACNPDGTRTVTAEALTSGGTV
ncbi:MAG TPA: hypothetical protein VI854_00800, partial [Acidimicrobiia bacterium]|nr:hypothetical protein [Acidimicrobiia bacterium]